MAYAASSTNLPWFAIGGINSETIEDVIGAGARRVAVSAAVVRADRPRAAAAALRARLDEVWRDAEISDPRSESERRTPALGATVSSRPEA
ncbi:MAG: thiamine phosphate synthase [Isosphaeraceae bacterium]